MNASIHVINVGQGDGIVVNILEDSVVYWAVIDCHNPHERQDSPVLAFLKTQGVQILDCVCLTHPDSDHYSGLYQLLEYFSSDGRQVKRYCDCGLDPAKYQSLIETERDERELRKLYRFILDQAAAGLIEYVRLDFGSTLIQTTSAHLMALGPLGTSVAKFVKQYSLRLVKIQRGESSRVDKHLLSVLISLEDSDTAALLCSDARKDMIGASTKRWSGERKRAKKAREFAFVKVSHHGSRANNDMGLWKDFTIRGKSSAAISSGGLYGLPNREVVESIISAGVALYCTNRVGYLGQVRTSSARTKRIPSSSLLQTGLDLISKPLPQTSDIDPLHGDICFYVSGKRYGVRTQYPVAPIDLPAP